MEIEFDFREEQSRIFGPILRPIARIIFIGANGIEVPEHLYVDSGADSILVPKSLGDLLGFKMMEGEVIEEIKGIGERGIPIVVKNAKIHVGEKIMEVRVAWALVEEVPLLLGRTDVFAHFDITFKKNNKIIFTY